jgi:hypothetical protein
MGVDAFVEDWEPPDDWESELIAHQGGGPHAEGLAVLPIAVASAAVGVAVVVGFTHPLTFLSLGPLALSVAFFVWHVASEPLDRSTVYYFDPADPDNGIYENEQAPSRLAYWTARQLRMPPPEAKVRRYRR